MKKKTKNMGVKPLNTSSRKSAKGKSGAKKMSYGKR